MSDYPDTLTCQECLDYFTAKPGEALSRFDVAYLHGQHEPIRRFRKEWNAWNRVHPLGPRAYAEGRRY